MLSWKEILLRLALAAVFGAVIGIERERKDWAAGMRTHMMVSMGASLIMIVSSFGFMDVAGKGYTSFDPSRIAAQIVSGIGFIGAGAILFLKPATILGLTTAAGLWTVAGIGMATGGGMYMAASITTILALIILWGLQPLQRIFTNKFQHKSITIVTRPGADFMATIEKLLENHEMEYSNFSIIRQPEENIIEVKLDKPGSKHLIKFIEKLERQNGIKKISWSK